MLRHSCPIEINGHPIASTQDIINTIQSSQLARMDTVISKFSIIEKVAMYPQLDIPILCNDQLKLLPSMYKLQYNMEEQGSRNQRYLNVVSPCIATIKAAKNAKLPRHVLNLQENWLI